MEVTRTNFQEVLTELEEVLKDAAFLAIDGEFTGLNSGPDASAFDTPAQYYSKVRAGSMDFLLVQFGLSIFTLNEATQKYVQRSYNFYVFPQPLNRAAPDCRFMCQASCISFLASQGFDFNKLFKFGVPYLTKSEEEKLVKRLEEKQKARDEEPDLIPISDDDKPQIEEICGRIDDFISSDALELTITKCNSFIRRLVYQEARLRWPSKLVVESKSECTGEILIVRRSGTKEEEQKKEKERREREKLEIKHAVGLSALFQLIAESEKLIVGHNMLYDILHVVHQCIGPLPESYQECKALLHSLFPRILDTKIICRLPEFREILPSSNLNVLLETVSKKPFAIPEIECIEGRSYSTLADKCHEAGYDAYITGLCFIALSNFLGSLKEPLLKPLENKLPIARLKDIPYINLVTKDPNPNRDNVFHITFPKEWKHNDISQLFSPFGGVQISWLSDTSAYVGLYRRDQASAVMKSLSDKLDTYKIQKYVEHQATLERTNVPAERKRKSTPSECAAEQKEDNALPSNGVKPTQAKDGWEVATGNFLTLPSKPIPRTPYPRKPSKYTWVRGQPTLPRDTEISSNNSMRTDTLTTREKDVGHIADTGNTQNFQQLPHKTVFESHNPLSSDILTINSRGCREKELTALSRTNSQSSDATHISTVNTRDAIQNRIKSWQATFERDAVIRSRNEIAVNTRWFRGAGFESNNALRTDASTVNYVEERMRPPHFTLFRDTEIHLNSAVGTNALKNRQRLNADNSDATDNVSTFKPRSKCNSSPKVTQAEAQMNENIIQNPAAFYTFNRRYSNGNDSWPTKLRSSSTCSFVANNQNLTRNRVVGEPIYESNILPGIMFSRNRFWQQNSFTTKLFESLAMLLFLYFFLYYLFPM